VDLERHKIVDLLGEHSVESLAKWLSKHPKVEVASRDRSHICREGLSAGAPQATQVADRWHLLRNLAETLDEFLGQKRPILKAATGSETVAQTGSDEDSDDLGLLGIGLGVDDVDARGTQARDEQVATLHVGVGRVGAKCRRASGPAEVVNLVADVQFDPAHDLLVGRGVWVNMHDSERVGAPVAIGVQDYHIS
jgi:hypothetical protein